MAINQGRGWSSQSPKTQCKNADTESVLEGGGEVFLEVTMGQPRFSEQGHVRSWPAQVGFNVGCGGGDQATQG